jgi:hypothetical protein
MVNANNITTNSSADDMIQNINKRHVSDSCNPTSPQTQQSSAYKKIFSSSNRFEVLSQNTNLDKNSKVVSDDNLDTNTNPVIEPMVSQTIKIPPPIFAHGIRIF